jgi:hypothetical protein
MSKPYIHAISSARKFGGKPEDYEEIHNFMDSSKSAFPDNRHRAATHNSFFIGLVIERIKFSNSCQSTPDNRFPYIINSAGQKVFVRDVAEQHVLEDYKGKFIPSLSDWCQEIEYKDWMQNGNGNECPVSNIKIKKYRSNKHEQSN